MSDEDAAKDEPTTDAEAKADAPRPQDTTDADVTAKIEKGSTEAEGKSAEAESAESETVKFDTAKSEGVKSGTGEDETVKLGTAQPTPAASGPAGPAFAGSAEPTERMHSPQPGGGRSNLWPIVAAFAAGVVLVAAVTAVVVFYLQASDRGGQLDARDEATAAACDFGRQVGTYDSKNFDDYVKRVKDRSTGDWANQFDAASSALKDITTQAQARSGIDEIHCAWESGDDSKATVIMLITQNQSKAATPQPQKMTIGVVATMENKDGKWLASSFQSPMMNDMGGGSTVPAPGVPSGAGEGQPGEAPAPQPGG
ncbi:hypothetical protein [Nocardia sp. BMG51109]|uniref:hypothetical protein n=1 Tax=Nocardia sp. BMG51109 TaxID=1056816 RepID=UPI0012EC5933|nr:hypothetical protein [Nocardia sp. BMG51109]